MEIHSGVMKRKVNEKTNDYVLNIEFFRQGSLTFLRILNTHLTTLLARKLVKCVLRMESF